MTEVSTKGAEGDVLLRVRDLAKAYGPSRVLDGIDFDLARGETLVVLGGSGSGKSVTLRLVDGLEAADRGSVVFGGTELTELTERELFPIRRRIAMLFQGGALFDSMNVFENIAFPLREHTDLDEDAIAGRVRERLALVRLDDGRVEERMPADLSGGMKKRVALARSLALDPELMLYDEPSTGLDPVTSAVIAELILTTRDRLGVASIVVTHDLPLARRVADRLAYLRDGRFRFLGTWAEAAASDDEKLRSFLEGRPEMDDAD